MTDERRRGFRDLPFRRRLTVIVGLSFGVLGVVAGIVGLIRIDLWDTTVTHAVCTVDGVTGPELYGKSQHQWSVHTLDCGDLVITVGNPGYPFSGGEKLADRLSVPARYRLTLHGWGDHKDIVTATQADRAAANAPSP